MSILDLKVCALFSPLSFVGDSTLRLLVGALLGPHDHVTSKVRFKWKCGNWSKWSRNAAK